MMTKPEPALPAHITVGDDGKIDVTVTYLRMHSRPAHPPRPMPHLGKPLALVRCQDITVSFYRYLYNSVGDPWLWYERRRMSDDALRAAVTDPAVSIDVLWVGGVPAGYFELDRRDAGTVQLAYFGLIPEFIGYGLGRYLLDAAIDAAWQDGPASIWVHTCDLDHPHALPLYQRAGFEPEKREIERIDDPRGIGCS